MWLDLPKDQSRETFLYKIQPKYFPHNLNPLSLPDLSKKTMRTIGQLIRDARAQKRYSRSKLEEITKIKTGFIEALEAEDWEKLPEYPVLQGFVRNISEALKLDQKNLSAVLRRDYPPKDLRINPKPDVATKFMWNPRLTFLLGIFVVSLMIIGYLTFQYVSFISPPKVSIDFPNEGQVVRKRELKVTGIVEKEAAVFVNNQPALVDGEGSFSATIEIFEGTEEIVIKAIKRSGRETIIKRKIKPELN